MKNLVFMTLLVICGFTLGFVSRPLIAAEMQREFVTENTNFPNVQDQIKYGFGPQGQLVYYGPYGLCDNKCQSQVYIWSSNSTPPNGVYNKK